LVLAVSTEDRRLFFLLAQAQRAVTKRGDARLLAELGVTTAQVGALLFLARPGEVGEGRGLNASAVTGLATRLEKLGLATRREDPDDGRAYRLTLTAAGRKKAAAALPLVKSYQAELVAGFSADELDTVIKFLRHLSTRFEESP
jgi:DNA-binding MarR family transcriptional regulator